MEKLPDPSDSPTLVPESSAPGRSQAPAQTLTPPPSSADSPTLVPESSSADAPTMVPQSPSGAGQTGAGVSSTGDAWAAASLQPGAILGGRYEILQALGEGGMGTVYKARDRELDRLVALKVIRPDLARNPAIIQRFKQELILARQVTHRNVVRIFDLGEADGIKFITMEFIEGKDLRSLLLEHKKFSPEEAAEVIRQVCLALDTAHTEGVIHRDLKPQNIMRDAQGRIVVMDFGLARSLESDGMTQTGALIGTMEYMSPEQGLGQELDQRSDLFTLGLIFYELLTGQVPYKADSALASLLKRTQERAAPISQLDNQVPRVLSNIVAKCLERDPKLRYSTAKELLTDLEAWQGKSAAASIRLPSVQPWGQDIPWVWISVAAVVVILAVTGFLLRGKLFGPGAKAPTGPVVSLAILPFRNASGDSSLDWLGSSLADMLSAGVGQSSQLSTVSPDHLHQVLADLKITPETSLDPATIRRVAEFSSADTVISGRYARLGNQLHIEARVQDLKHDSDIPLSVDAPADKDLAAAVGRLADAIRQNLALAPDIVKQLREQSFKPSTASLDALRDYTQGLDLMRQGNNLEAVKHFQSATQEDPNFALAYANLGESYSRLGYGDKAEEFSQKAVDLSQQLPAQERYRILANQAVVSNDNKKAIEYYENLAKVSPSDSEIQLTLAQLYEKTGAYDTARDHLRKLLAREPNNTEALITLAHVEGESRNPQGALDNLGRANQLAVQLDSDELRGRVSYGMGWTYRLLNKPEEALRNYQESLVIRRRLGQKAGVAQTLAEMGEVEYSQGKPEDAIAHYKEALQLQRDIGDKTYLSHTLLNLGGIYSDRGQYEEALGYLKESLQLQRELHDQNYEAMCLNNIGNVYLSTARYDDALTYYQQALDLFQKLNATSAIPVALNNLGDTSTRLGQYDQAESYYLRSLELARNSGSKPFVALASFSLGNAFEYQGRYGAALSAQRDAVNTYRQMQDRTGAMAEALSGYGHTLSLLGQSSDAKKILDEAVSLARELKDNTNLARALNRQGQRLFYDGDLKGARPPLNEALQSATRSRDPETVLLVKISLAQLAVSEGRGRELIPELKKLAKEADSLGLKYSSVQCSLYLAQALVDTKQYSSAQEQADQARRTSERLGFKYAAALSRYTQGEILVRSGKPADATTQFQQARQMLQDIANEAHSESFLKRSDLRPVVSATTH